MSQQFHTFFLINSLCSLILALISQPSVEQIWRMAHRLADRADILLGDRRAEIRSCERAADHTDLTRMNRMSTGTVKWFNTIKGYGFITPDDGASDAFVHISAVERAGLSNLREGQRVEYELQRGKNGKSSAENLSLVD